MTVQTVSLLLSAAAILILAAVFLRVRVLAHAVEDYAPVQGRAYRMRAIAFWLMLLVGLPVSIWLLRDMPYKADASFVWRAWMSTMASASMTLQGDWSPKRRRCRATLTA